MCLTLVRSLHAKYDALGDCGEVVAFLNDSAAQRAGNQDDSVNRHFYLKSLVKYK